MVSLVVVVDWPELKVIDLLEVGLQEVFLLGLVLDHLQQGLQDLLQLVAGGGRLGQQLVVVQVVVVAVVGGVFVVQGRHFALIYVWTLLHGCINWDTLVNWH